jgi:hypothetical protein
MRKKSNKTDFPELDLGEGKDGLSFFEMWKAAQGRNQGVRS